ncbi:MAG: hypothetical protein E7646_05880 [Ruminococcaceae bacterium]|nr:hypothetical protein [Oscillospiraceae bacterium]
MEKSKVVIPERFKDHPLFNEIICGTNFGFMAKRGYYLKDDIISQPEKMAKAGINWTTLNLNFCQDKYTSEKVYLDFEYSSSDYEISEMVKRLHDNGIRVLFKPCLTNLDGVWMGKVAFPSPKHSNQIAGVKNSYAENWFKSYIEAYKYFCELAERNSMDAMMIGCEYFGIEGEDEYWDKVISSVRGGYSAPITYEFTPESLREYSLEWFKKLDFLSYSFYPAAADERVEISKEALLRLDPSEMKEKTVEEMKEYLTRTQRDTIAAISRRFGNMPIAFTEYGTRSNHGNILRPYTTRFDSYYDGKEQADYMEASFSTFWDIPQWMGLFWWKWDETQYRPHYHTDPKGDKGFTVQGKPAEEVMRRWCTKKNY